MPVLLRRTKMYSKQARACAAHAPIPAAAEGLRVVDAAIRTRTVTARDIELFTEITGDRNPLHYDPKLARRSASAASSCRAGSPAACSTPWSPRTCPGQAASSSTSTGPSAPRSARERDHRRSCGHTRSGPTSRLTTPVRPRSPTRDGTVVLDGTAVVWQRPAIAMAECCVPRVVPRGAKVGLGCGPV